jgi:hypothetical protein
MTVDLETTGQNEPVSQSLKLGWEEGYLGTGYDYCDLYDIDGDLHPWCKLGPSVLQRPEDRE